ncbi:hypothetical protein PR001_g12756 [Phytophthora rubi]|uniref:Secreted protein n=1 Tax=Phytophthora rubi TaxID=129364 RepID=A0A6A3M115_9STRA|nr:hypothetical protein PR001_g12756 [Phytophthora rubi]
MNSNVRSALLSALQLLTNATSLSSNLHPNYAEIWRNEVGWSPRGGGSTGVAACQSKCLLVHIATDVARCANMFITSESAKLFRS